MRRVCTICARGGSKGVPGKNIRLLAGKPLIAHTVAQALASGLFDVVAASSDSEAILDAAVEAGATMAISRPDEFATDTAGKAPAIRHALEEVERRLGATADILVDLDATSPLRAVQDIVDAVALLDASGAPNVITASPARRSPYFNMVETDEEGRVRLSKTLETPVLRRQDAPACYDMNASIYVWRRDIFLDDPRVFYPETRLLVMPEERSHDIDSEVDFAWVTWLMERQRG